MERKKTKLKNEKSDTKNESISGPGQSLGVNIRIAILFILHIVGLAGYSLSEYKVLFQAITPFHLIIIAIVLFFEKPSLTAPFWIFFGLSFFIGYVAEVFGVKSGLLFGYYEYTEWLGFSLLEVPVVIGVLWAATAYACNQVASKLFPYLKFGAIIMAALLMVLIDYMIEPFAVSANLWVWHMSVIPAYNYFSWFIIGLVLSIIYQYTLKRSDNQVAPYFILTQLLFFLGFQLINGNFTLNPFD